MEQVRRERNVGHAGNGAGFAVVERLQFGEFIGIFQEQIADAPDGLPRSLGVMRRQRSRIKSAAGGGDGVVDVFRFAFSGTGDDRIICWIENFKCLAGSGGDPFAIDQILLGL